MRTDIINNIIQDRAYTRYLEIGYQNGYNFDKVICQTKLAIDPYPLKMSEPKLITTTSDHFFMNNINKFDIIFIDGLHHADQVRKDIINASKFLTQNGCIILHDLLPQSELAAQRERCNGAWNGDCWRAAVGLLNKHSTSNFTTHNTDHGVGVLFPSGSVYEGEFEDMGMTWEYFNRNKNELLKVI